MRIPATAALLLALSACSGAGPPATGPGPVTSHAPPTVAGAPFASTATAPQRLQRPTDVLASFRAEALISLAGEDSVPGFANRIGSTFHRGDFDCRQESRVGDLAATQAAIVRRDGTWLQPFDETGFVAVVPQDPRLAALLPMCPGFDGFWSPFDRTDLTGVRGEATTQNGVDALRIDLKAVDAAAVPDLLAVAPGASVETFTLWVAGDGAYPVAFELVFTLTPEAAERDFGIAIDADVVMTYRLDVTRPDDATLAVTPP